MSENLTTRTAFSAFMLHLYKKVRYAYQRGQYNRFVKAYYKKNKTKKFSYEKNIWSNNYFWDFFFQNLPHSVKSKYYVSPDYYAFEIEPKLNRKYTAFCTEKNMYDKIFSNTGVELPETVLRCMNSIYLDGDYCQVDDIHSFCNTIAEDIIVKPAAQSCGGKGIRKYVFLRNALYDKDGKKFSIERLTTYYKGNFIIQRIVSQHREIARFHSHSLNTMRIFSYRSVKTNIVHTTMAILRMGVSGSYLDNFSLNGIACGIKEDGSLMKYALDRFGNCYTHHPNTKIEFEGFNIPSFDRVLMRIGRLADSIPHQRVVGWDFGVDVEENPVFIEVNVGSGVSCLQAANGRPLFGAFSQEVKDYMDANE